MLLCATVSRPHLDELGVGQMMAALSHWVGDGQNAYTDFYRRMSEAGRYVFLNNGAYEAFRDGLPLPTLEETLARAEAIGAREVQFPERAKDGRGTVKVIRRWISEMGSENASKYRWNAVVQGKNRRDYDRCFDTLAELDAVHVLGIPKGITPMCFRKSCGTEDLSVARKFALETLLRRTDKPVHLLGLDDPREVLQYRSWGDRVRSVDSCSPVLHALHGVRYSEDLESYPLDLPRFGMDAVFPQQVLELARHNITTLRGWCGERALPHSQGVER